jgi:hypothetical protein
MSEKFQVTMILDPFVFERMMTEDDYKKHIKQQLAYELAMKLIESNRTSFTYSNNYNDNKITVKGTITL